MKPESSTGMLNWKTRERHGIITRGDALKNSIARYFTGYPCDRGHIAERDTKTQKCLECIGEEVQQRRANLKTPKPHPTCKVSESERRDLIEQQGGLCAICSGPIRENDNAGRRLANVDHCHETGKIRGVLCGHCNRGLGYFRDDPDRLRAAIRYLTRIVEPG